MRDRLEYGKRESWVLEFNEFDIEELDLVAYPDKRSSIPVDVGLCRVLKQQSQV